MSFSSFTCYRDRGLRSTPLLSPLLLSPSIFLIHLQVAPLRLHPSPLPCYGSVCGGSGSLRKQQPSSPLPLPLSNLQDAILVEQHTLLRGLKAQVPDIVSLSRVRQQPRRKLRKERSRREERRQSVKGKGGEKVNGSQYLISLPARPPSFTSTPRPDWRRAIG